VADRQGRSAATSDDFEVVREAIRFAPQPELDRALTALERIEQRLLPLSREELDERGL
jgi:hypothetical protein